MKKSLLVVLFMVLFCYISHGGWIKYTKPGISGNLKSVYAINEKGITVAENGKVFKTENYGFTWIDLNKDLSGQVNCVTINNGTYYAGNSSGLFKHNNIWEPIDSLKMCYSIYFLSENSTLGWAAGDKTIYYTTDGTNWTKTNSTINENIYSIYFKDKDTGWAVGEKIFKTYNGGVDWKDTLSSWTGIKYASFALGTNNGCIVGTNGQTAKITGGVIGPVKQQNPGPFNSVWISSEDNTIGWAVGDNGKVLKTTNGGTDWNLYYTDPDNSKLNSVYFVDTSLGFAVGANGTILKYIDYSIRPKLPPFTHTCPSIVTTPVILTWSAVEGAASYNLYTKIDGNDYSNNPPNTRENNYPLDVNRGIKNYWKVEAVHPVDGDLNSFSIECNFTIPYTELDIDSLRLLDTIYNDNNFGLKDNINWVKAFSDNNFWISNDKWDSVKVGNVPQRVIGLNLSGKNLKGAIPAAIGRLDSLNNLDLSNNEIESIPKEINNLTTLDSLNLSENKFDFFDLKKVIKKPNFFKYSPQDSIGTADNLIKDVGATLEIVAGDEFTEGNIYEWKCNGTKLDSQTNHKLAINGLTESHTGTYTCKVTNPDFDSLTLDRKHVIVKISDANNIHCSIIDNKKLFCVNDTSKTLEVKFSGGSGSYQYRIAEFDTNWKPTTNTSATITIIGDNHETDKWIIYKLEVRDNKNNNLTASDNGSFYIYSMAKVEADETNITIIGLYKDTVLKVNKADTTKYDYVWIKVIDGSTGTGFSYTTDKFNSTGTYKYKLIAKHKGFDRCESVPVEITITVTDTLGIQSSQTVFNVCEGDSIPIGSDFNITPSGGSYSYIWEKVTGELDWLSLTDSLKTTFSKSNISTDEPWQYKLVVTDNSDTSKTAEKTITINVLNIPEPTAKAENEGGYYSGETATITILNYNPKWIYTWYDNKTDNIESTKIINGKVKIDNADITLYLGAKINDIDRCETAPSVRYELKIICNKPNNLIITFNRADTSICAGDVISITANISGGSGKYTYEWSPDNSIISGQNTATIEVKPTETTVYTLKVTDGNNKSVTKTFTVTVNPLPKIEFEQNPYKGYKNKKLTLKIKPASDCNYYWFSSLQSTDTLSKTDTYNITVSETVTYYVSAKNSKTGCETKDSIKVILLNSVPIINIDSITTENIPYVSTNKIEIGKDLNFKVSVDPLGDDDSVVVQLTFNPTIFYIIPDIYNNGAKLTLVDSNNRYYGHLRFTLSKNNWTKEIKTKIALGNSDIDTLIFCGSSNGIIFTPDTSIVNINVCDKGGKRLIENVQKVRIKIDPNPAKESIKITYTTPEACKTTFKILDLLGTEMIKFEGNITQTGEQTKEIDICKLQTGIYYLMMMDCNGNIIGTPLNVSK
jgi:photosystem II stability/assembly factor-like uncharacterized protein